MTDEYDNWRRYEDAKAFKNKLAEIDRLKDRSDKLEDELLHCFHRINALQTALRNIAEGDIPRTVKIPFHDDGRSSKHDRCEHGQCFYEDCGCCIEDYARKALEGKDDPQADL